MRFSLGIIAGIVAAAAACALLAGVTVWGHFIPTDNAATDYASAVIMAALIGAGISLWPFPREEKSDLLLLWLLRCGTTLGFMLLYENNYGLDAYAYFADAREPSYDWASLGFGRGTENIGAIVWYLNHLIPLPDSFHALKVVFSFFGFIAVYIFYSSLVYYLGSRPRWLLLALGGFPSLIFWSSILGKDPVILFGISVYCAGMLRYLRSGSIVPFLFALGGALGASAIRPWTAVILTIPTVVAFTLRYRNWPLRIVGLVMGGYAMVQSAQIVADRFLVVGVDDLVKKANLISKAWGVGGSAQAIPDFYNVSEMLSFAPAGMFTALFRPLPGEVNNMFGILAGLENGVLLFLVLSGIYRARWRAWLDPAVVWALATLFSWSLVYGFVSSQNLGSAFRFRLQVLPLLLSLALYLRYFGGKYHARKTPVNGEGLGANHLIRESFFDKPSPVLATGKGFRGVIQQPLDGSR